MLKIIHIIPALLKGGAERLVLDICNALIKRENISVTLITFSEKNEYKTLSKNIHWHVIPATFIPSFMGSPVKNIIELQNFIDKYNPDVIHSHLWETEIVMTKIDTGKALRISHFHDNMPQLRKTYLPKSKKDITNLYEQKLFFNSISKNTHQFICISNDTLNYAKNTLPKKLRSNIHLIFNAINLKNFENDINQVNIDEIRLLNVGSFVPKKNQQFAIDILDQIIKNRQKANLTFLGDGYLLDEVKNYSKSMGLNEFIEFKGNTDDVNEYYNNSSIYLHTAKYEPFGLVLLEAMASGLPVVSLDGGGNRDIISNDNNGFLIKKEDPTLFSQIIIKLHRDSKLYKRISDGGSKTAEKHDINIYVDNLLKIYFSVTI